MFEDAVMKGRCPACGCETRQKKRWFKAVREIATTVAIRGDLEKLLNLTKRADHGAGSLGSEGRS